MTLNQELAQMLHESASKRLSQLRLNIRNKRYLAEQLELKLDPTTAIDLSDQAWADVDFLFVDFPHRARKWVEKYGAIEIPGLRLGDYEAREQLLIEEAVIPGGVKQFLHHIATDNTTGASLPEFSVENLRNAEHQRAYAYFKNEQLVPRLHVGRGGFLWIMVQVNQEGGEGIAPIK